MSPLISKHRNGSQARRKNSTAYLILIFAFGISLSQPGYSQVSVVRSGSFEVGGFVGASYGVDKFRPMGGGNVTYAINKWILPYGEFSYFPGIARDIHISVPGLATPVTGTFSVPLADIHGGVHIRVP